MKVLVTGASGYIGQRLVRSLADAGHEVVAAGRSAVPGFAWYRLDLSEEACAPVPAGVEAIVHLAADTSGGADAALQARQVHKARQLVAEATRTGARMVFVSSQTARPDAPTNYGRTKWEIEQLVLAAGGTVVRPGQVYGGPQRGLYGTLVGAVERMPLLPAFLPQPMIQPVHVDDLAQALSLLATGPAHAGEIFCIAAPEPLGFTDFLRAIASQRVDRARWFVPVPVALVRLARTLTGDRVAPLQRLGSLFGLQPMASKADLQRLGMTLRPLHEGLRRRRHALLRESSTLLRYVLGAVPQPALVRRQARAVERLRGGDPLRLPRLARTLPGVLACVEARASRAPADQEFSWRLDCATAIAEASPQGAGRFLAASGGPVRAFGGLLAAALAEAGWRLAAPALRPLLRRS